MIRRTKMRRAGRAVARAAVTRQPQSDSQTTHFAAPTEALEGRLLMAAFGPVSINFQPADAPVPAGFLVDAGAAYGDRGNGYTYGWGANNATTRDRNAANSPSQAHDTLIHTQQDGANHVWNIAVPSGNYRVRLVAGDPTGTTGVYRTNAEQTLLVNGNQTTANRWVEGNAVIAVADGRLTITNGSGARSTKLCFIEIVSDDTPAPTDRPAITATSPAAGQTGVSRDAFVGADLSLPNGALDVTTVTSSTVTLRRTRDNTLVSAVVNSSGGGDSIVLQPRSLLDANTQYTFAVTSGVRDQSGAALVPFSMSFTTGTTGGPPVQTDIGFDKVSLSGTGNQSWTSVAVGPDRRLYASTLEGYIHRFPINANGTLGTGQVISTIRTANGGSRMLLGIVFDPAATADDLRLWVTHGDYSFDTSAEHWSGEVTLLTGSSLQTARDVVVGLPRAAHNHLTNQAAFGPDGALYISQGGNTAQGGRDSTWGFRDESLLSAAVLRLDTTRITPGSPLNARTIDGGGSYNPFAAGAPLTVYASGFRNAYDLVWTEDGKLYVPNNGSNPGGATPGTPSPFRGPYTPRIDQAENGPYTGPQVPRISTLNEGQNDYLFLAERNGYYGHPNPSRHEYVLNGGNPTSGTDRAEVRAYPVGTQPDRNYRGFAYDFGSKRSANGIIEYRSNAAFGGALKGKLLVVQYSGGDNIVVLTRDASGKITQAQGNLPGMTNFSDPLDLIEDPLTGNIYVAEHGGDVDGSGEPTGQRLTLLRPRSVSEPQPPQTGGTWAAGPQLPVAMSEVGGGVIGSTLYALGEGTANTYKLNLASSTATWVDANADRPFLGEASDAEHATEVFNGKLYLFGGLGNGSERKTQIYDPTSNSWTLGEDLPYKTGSAASAVINGEIYLAGGALKYPQWAPVASVSKYNPATDTWTTLRDMPFPRHAASYGTDGQKLYVFGGRPAGLEASSGTNTVQVYDPATNTWQTSEDPGTNIPRLPRKLRGASRAVFHNGEFFIFGGETSYASDPDATSTLTFKRVDVYNPITRAWRRAPDMTTARHALLAAGYQNKIYTVGGGTQRGTSLSRIVEVLTLPSTPPPTTPSVTVSATDASAAEAGPNPGAFTFTRSGSTTSSLTVAYTFGGTATAGGDFTGATASGTITFPAGSATALLTITPVDDAAVEGNETAVLTLAAGSGYAVGSPSAATVTIADNDTTPPTGPVVTITATDPQAAESGAAGGGMFTVSRTGSTTTALTVSYTVGGTAATDGSDYAALIGSVTIPAGSSTAVVAITPVNDTLVEGAETATLTLAGGAGYSVGSPAAATVTIADDDGGGPVSPVSLAATAAALVRGGVYARQNFNDPAELMVKESSNPDNDRQALLKFDTSSFSGAIGSVKLRLTGRLQDTRVSSLLTEIFGAGTAWQESTVTWNTRPQPTSAARLGSVTLRSATPQTFEVDITNYVNAERAAGRNVIGLLLKNVTTSSPNSIFNGRGAAGAPELVITPAS